MWNDDRLDPVDAIKSFEEERQERIEEAMSPPHLFTFTFPDGFVEEMVEARKEGSGPGRGPRLVMTTEQCERLVEKGILDDDEIDGYTHEEDS